MRKMLLSMQPFWKDKIMSGDKIYEYRSRFPKEEIMAYLYVSSPVCAITGILYLGEYQLLAEWKEKYHNNSEVLKRILDYESRKNKMAMPVLSYQDTTALTRKELDKNIKKFVVPQSYYYLTDDMELTKYIIDNIQLIGDLAENDFSAENPIEICRTYRS